MNADKTLLFILCILVPTAAPARGQRSEGAAPGDRLPGFALPRLGGGVVRWEPGQITVLSFCAIWCDTWKEQNARLAAARRAVEGLPVEFLTVSVDGRWAERGQGRAMGTVLLDRGSALSGSLQIHTVPYTVVADARGQVRYAAQGILRGDLLLRSVRALAAGDSAASAGTVYLTFDDFPTPADEALLDLLRAHGARATFFCIGEHVGACRAAVRRAALEGHSLQLHSWRHDAARPELERCARALLDATGTRATLYRPPGRVQIRRLDGSAVPLPVVNPYDYTRPGERELIRRVLLAVKPGSVLLLHAGVAETRSALPQILQALRQRGYSFGVLQ